MLCFLFRFKSVFLCVFGFCSVVIRVFICVVVVIVCVCLLCVCV